MLSCVSFAGESLCPKGGSDGVTIKYKKYDMYVRTLFIMHLRERQHEERHIIATACIFLDFFLVFFCVVDDRKHPRPIQF